MRTPKHDKSAGGGKLGHQCAALPHCERDGETMVLLVTSRETRRWVLPKGWAEPGLTEAELAGKEAFEEAGIVGRTAPAAIGWYRYIKRLPRGHAQECRVAVFPLRVDRLLDDWPERHERHREWFTLAQAAMLVDEADLAFLLLELALPTASAFATQAGAAGRRYRA